MSFSSRSSSGRHYRNAHHGSKHYQKKGFMGKLFDIIASRSWSRSGHDNYGRQYGNAPVQDQPVTGQSAMTCRKCNSRIPAGSKFCLQCGEKVSEVSFCMNCGEKLPPDARFCLRCGNRVSK